MSKARLIITAVIVEGRSQADVAREYEVSKGWVSKLVARYRAEGDKAFEPRSRRPHTSPTKTADNILSLIVGIRTRLSSQGLDAGMDTIQWHLKHHHHIEVKRPDFSGGLFLREPDGSRGCLDGSSSSRIRWVVRHR